MFAAPWPIIRLLESKIRLLNALVTSEANIFKSHPPIFKFPFQVAQLQILPIDITKEQGFSLPLNVSQLSATRSNSKIFQHRVSTSNKGYCLHVNKKKKNTEKGIGTSNSHFEALGKFYTLRNS